jgi:hypothetical protein
MIASRVDVIFEGVFGKYVVSGYYLRGDSRFFACLVVCREGVSAGTTFFTIFKFRKKIRTSKQAAYAA